MKRFVCALVLFAFGVAPALADPKSDVLAALIPFAKAQSFHFTFAGKGPSVNGDMVLPGKMHIIAPQMEMIKIDQTMWVKVGGQWRQFNFPGADQMTAGLNNAVAAAHANPDDFVVTDLGMKKPNSGGAQMHAYNVTNKAGKSPATMLIDGGALNEVDNADGSYVKFSKIGVPVDITPPM